MYLRKGTSTSQNEKEKKFRQRIVSQFIGVDQSEVEDKNAMRHDLQFAEADRLSAFQES